MFRFPDFSGAILLTALLPLVLGTNHIDIALQKRQQIVPIGTGVTPSSPQPTSGPSTASSTAASTNAAPSAAPYTASSSVEIIASDSSAPSGTPASDITVPSPVTSTSNSPSQITSSRSSSILEPKSSTDSVTSFDVIPTRSDSSLVVLTRSTISSSQRLTSTIVTVKDGKTTSSTVITDTLVLSTSTSSATAAPGLNSANDRSNNPGLSPSSKRTIIGVVVGIGGAIVLVGLAFVAWIIWGRRRNVGDDNNDLIGSHPGSSGHEKTSSVSGNTPFKSTLDQYHSAHSPPGPVNTASNF